MGHTLRLPEQRTQPLLTNSLTSGSTKARDPHILGIDGKKQPNSKLGAEPDKTKASRSRADKKAVKSPSVLHRTTILCRKFLDIDEGQKLLADRARAVADDLHLGERCGGQEGFEEPEDPGHEGGDVDEELARLSYDAMQKK